MSAREVLRRLALFGALLHLALADNLALLSGTLRTYQTAGCDAEVVVLKCPAGTSILIQVAQYGRSAPSNGLCGPQDSGDGGTCLWPKALQTVVEACQKKRQCRIDTSPKAFGGDPCPGMRKYVEIAYKCRPYEFRSKMACENEILQLKCNPHSRVAVYSASYGRTEYESFQCPQPQGVAEETCLVSYAMETVMQICHGKRSCELSADASTFGNPCKPESRMYLKVVYTCVPRKILKEQYEGRLEPDELDTDDDREDGEFDNYEDGRESMRESAASPPAPSVVGGSKGANSTGDLLATSSKRPPRLKRKESENRERFYLYLIISIAAAVVVLLTILVARLLVQRRRAAKLTGAKPAQTEVADGPLPNGFADDISEVDADIDLTPSLPPLPHVHHGALPMALGGVAEVVRYPQVHGLAGGRRDPEPRGLSHYYYG